MNQIKAIQALNKREIENGISPEASWHADYRDTAYINFGGLPYELTEGDALTIFSQFGEPVFLKLVRDKETGKSKGFGWLKYENQRSTDLAVDNLGGADVGGRSMRVDHARYRARDDEDQDEFRVGWEDIMRREGKPLEEDEGESSAEEERRPMLPQERELALLMQEHDDDDPMKGFLIEEKRKEVQEAKEQADRKDSKRKHRHHRSHRSRRDESDDERPKRSHRDDRDRRDREEEGAVRRHSHRDDDRGGERRRRRADDDDGQDESKRRPETERRRHSRERDLSEESRHRRPRDDKDRGGRGRRRSRSRSPRNRDDR